MSTVQPLSHAEVENALGRLPDWHVAEGKLHADFKFGDFVEAFAFMTQVALTAERMNHHPEWFNVYNRVIVDLVTHEANDQISQLDVDLAERISGFAA